MDIQNHLERWKTRVGQGVDLLLMRLQILQLDAAEQAGSLLFAMVAVAVSAVLLLLAGISLLFGLNGVLDDETKIRVFFGIPAACLLVIAVLLWRAVTLWRCNNRRLSATLRDIRQDIACLRGERVSNEENKHEQP